MYGSGGVQGTVRGTDKVMGRRHGSRGPGAGKEPEGREGGGNTGHRGRERRGPEATEGGKGKGHHLQGKKGGVAPRPEVQAVQCILPSIQHMQAHHAQDHHTKPLYNMDPCLGALIPPELPRHQAPRHSRAPRDPALSAREPMGEPARMAALLAPREPLAEPAGMGAAPLAHEPLDAAGTESRGGPKSHRVPKRMGAGLRRPPLPTGKQESVCGAGRAGLADLGHLRVQGEPAVRHRAPLAGRGEQEAPPRGLVGPAERGAHSFGQPDIGLRVRDAERCSPFQEGRPARLPVGPCRLKHGPGDPFVVLIHWR